jgi:hypothetical protein
LFNILALSSASWVILDSVDIGLARAVPQATKRNVNIVFSYQLLQSMYNSPFLLIFLITITLPWFFFAAPISKAAILGIAVGGLVILLMILVAVCRPHSPPVLKDDSVSKPGNASTEFFNLLFQ